MAPAEDEFFVTAIIAARNEGDIIAQVLADLIAQKVDVYFIDHASSDDTVEQVTPFLGKGLLAIEHFPEESGFPPEDATRFAWSHILQRKEQLAQQLAAHWFIHHDADELRDSPWGDVPLRDAIRRVDRLGYNAIDFETYNFPPVQDGFGRGDDPRTFFRYYEPAPAFDARQIKCWKKQPGPVVLSVTGGHEVSFAGRKVFPQRFILRHYPIRSQEQGERKVFRDRQPRFVAEERKLGWHIQYDAIEPGTRFVVDAARLMPFDLEATRIDLQLRTRTVTSLEKLTADQEERLARFIEVLHGEQRNALGMSEELSRVWRGHADLERVIEQARRESHDGTRLLEQVAAVAQTPERLVEALRADSEARSRELSSLVEGREEARRDRDDAQRLREEATRDREDAQRVREEAARDREDAQRVREEAARDRDQAKAERAQAEAERDNALGSAGERLERLNEALARLDELERDRLGAAAERDRLAVELRVRALELDEARQTVDQLRADLALAESRRQELAALGGELTDARARQRALEQSAEALTEARVQLSRQLEALESRAVAAEAELAHMRAEWGNVLAALTEAEAQLDDMHGSRTWRLAAVAREAWRRMGGE